MKQILSFILLLLLLACKNQLSVPNGILPVKEMKGIVWNMIQVDQYYVLRHPIDSAKFRNQLTIAYSQIFYLHHTSRKTFYKSYDYYVQHPYLQRALFDSVYSLSVRILRESK